MDKILNHFKNNAIIYLILLLCLAILIIAIFVKEQQEPEEVDTSKFKVVTLKEAIKLFDDKDPKYLLISTHDCQATINFVPSVVIALATEQVDVYYLELTSIDTESEEDLADFAEFQKLLDLDYTFRGETKPVGEFIGNTPMNIIIKDRKVAFAFIGSMTTETTKTLMKRYLK